MKYRDLRTGLTFQAVRDELTGEQETASEKGDYMFVSRATVLGRWHQHKRELWDSLPADMRDESW